MVKRLLPFLLALCVSLLLVVPAAIASPFSITTFSMSAENQNGSPDVQAGSHPYALTTSFTLNENQPPEILYNDPKDIYVELPPGFVGDPHAMPRCSYALFGRGKCPVETQVGTETTSVANPNGSPDPVSFGDAVYSVEPSPGVAAEFGYFVAGIAPVLLDVSVRTGGDYGLTVKASNITTVEPLQGTTVTLWGVPAESSHDSLRGPGCYGGSQCGFHVNLPQLPLLTNPTSCGVPRTAKISMDSWEDPGSFISLSSAMPEISGCEKLDFSPSITVAPDGTAGSTPTGLNVDLHVPQAATKNPVGLAEADVKNTTVALPAGVQVSPSAADGLMACSEAQIGLHNELAPSCPDASKVANVEIDTPLLDEPLTGSVYLAAQNANPFGSLVALYVVAKNPRYGVLVKVAGQVSLDPTTGQLVTTFKETPALPFNDFKLQFFGTDRAPLTTPAVCGTYTTETSIEPWTETGPVTPSSKFQITSGPSGSPCSSPQPFNPSFQAGSTNLQAGAFSPFTLTMTRPDGNQTLSKIEMQMPPGLLGTLANVKLCGEPQAAQGTCGEDSLIGHTIVSAGLGNDPYSVTGGRVYITTGYNGAPYGLSIVNPAVAGPFDLGTVVVRAAIYVDPHTAALRIVGDPLPTILDGIPLQLQHVNVAIDREKFTLNPTSCEKQQITGTIASSEGATSQVARPFHVTNCAALAFEPRFAVSVSGKTSRANGAGLSVKLTNPPGSFGNDANIRSVKVDLPKQLPSRLTTLQKACPDATFNKNPAACPPESRVGEVTAITPILPEALRGPAYFVSHGGAKFPELIFVLQGYGVTIHIDGETFISKSGITSDTLRAVPDAPLSSFELTFPSGRYSALAANGNLCKEKLVMPTAFTAQNGAVLHQSTPIAVTGCKPAITVMSKRVKGAKATIVASVPSAGTLVASGTGLSRGLTRVAGAGTATVGVTLSRREQRVLSRRHGRRLKVSVKLVFTPTHGGRLSASTTVLMG